MFSYGYTKISATNKVVIRLSILALSLIAHAYIASEPEFSVEISFDSFHTIPHQQQPIHSSAASERYLHNQSLQQSHHSEQNLQRLSAQQLVQLFALKGYTQQQILNKRALYMNPEFVALAKSYAGYEQAVADLHQKLQQTSGFYKWLGTLNGYHKKGLTKQIAALYQELQHKKITSETADWSTLCDIYQKYGCGTCAHIQKRFDALECMKKQGDLHVHQHYELDRNVSSLLQSCGCDATAYTTVYGSQLQQVLHQECMELLARTAVLPNSPYAYDHQEVLVDCIDAAREYNREGLVHKASMVEDFCWALLDYSSAVLEGATLGIVGAVHDMITHPIQTAVCVIAGKYLLAYQLCKVVCNVADIGVTALVDASRAQEKWNDYIEPINTILGAIKNKEVTVRNAIKTGATLVVGLIAQHKLLGGLNKFYTTAKIKAFEFCQKNPLLRPRYHMTTPDGIFMKTPEGLTGLGTVVEEVVKDSKALLEGVHKAFLQTLESEIAALRTSFDRARKGFGGFASKYIKINYEHILGMELYFSRRGVPQIGGFHHDFMGKIEKSGVFEFVNKVVDKTGFYKAELLYRGESVKEITFFPAHWSRKEVISKIYEAYDNFIKENAVAELKPDGKFRLQGLTNEGVTIEMYITQQGKITTAYPKILGSS
jgi:hypothetical protein